MSEEEPKTVIKVDRVSKVFKLPHEKSSSLKSAIVNFYRRERSYDLQKALKDVSFEIKKGEFFGIVGRNGSGKSTMLKLLAGIYSPSKGSVKVEGSLTPFIELGVGFNPELTGRENVFLNGALLGFNHKEMLAMYDGIVEFAEIKPFMDQKLKNYSSGMQVRLAFSIAIKARSDILLIDEVLAVGDADFQQKCFDYFNELKRRKQTVVFITHDMSAVRRFCDRGILLSKGKLEHIGTPDEIARAYEKRLEKQDDDVLHYEAHEGNGDALIENVETFNPKTGKVQKTFYADEKIGTRLTFRAKADIAAPSVGFIFQDGRDTTVFATNNKVRKVTTRDVKKGERLVLESVIDNTFTDGEYSITCAIESTDFATIYDRIEHIGTFLLGGHELAHATVHPPHTFDVSYGKALERPAEKGDAKSTAAPRPKAGRA